VTGGVFVAGAFFTSAYLEYQLEANYPELIPLDQSRVSVLTSIDSCEINGFIINLNNGISKNFTINSGELSVNYIPQ
jgi:hypothetical protein